MGQLTLIVKPTNACNLKCKYCYIDPNAENGNMSSSVLEKLISDALSVPGKERVRFIWHGGEPLLMGVDFYEEVVNIQNAYKGDKMLMNTIQSNATLITDSFLDFFEKHNFRFGTSLDGPKEINDLTRIYSDGSGAFDDIWRGLQKVKERNQVLVESGKENIGGGAIVVLNKYNINRLDEIYSFFKSNNVNIKLNPLIKSGRAKENFEELGITAQEYSTAMKALFDKWFYEPGRGIDVDPFRSFMKGTLSGHLDDCGFGSSCRKSFLSIGPNGEVYPCGKFEGLKEFYLGNLENNSLGNILYSDRNACLARPNLEISGCSNCQYSKRCNGGCIHNSYTRSGKTTDKDIYCSAYKDMFKHIDGAIESELSKIKPLLKGGE